MSMPSRVFRFPRILILLLLFTFANFLGLLITPALPEIARMFSLSEPAGMWIMSVFLVGYTFGQLPYGPIANRFGRKPAITIGMLFALFGTILCYFAQDYGVFLLGRLIQSVGAAVGLKIGFTIIGDLNTDGQATKALATLSAAFGVMPGVAVFLGGYLTQYFGPDGCFIFLGAYIVILWLLCQSIPETAPQLHAQALKLPNIASNYGKQFKDSYLVLYAFLAGLSTSLLYIFSTLAPYLSIERIGITPEQYGYFALIPSIGLLSGAMISRSVKTPPRIMMISGILIVLFSSFVLSYLFAAGYVNLWSLFLPAFFMYMGCNLIWSNALSKGLTGASDKSNASAVMQFLNIGTAMVAVFIVQGFSPTATMLFPFALWVLIVLMFLSWFKLRAHH